MNKIKFSHNWNNKLSLPIFTTIRSWRISKGQYYGDCKDENTVFDILLNNKKTCEARIIDLTYFSQLSSIPTPLLLSDTGAETREEAYKIFAKFGVRIYDGVMILTLKQVNEK